MRPGPLLRWAPIWALTIVIVVLSYLPEGTLGFSPSHEIPGGDDLAHAAAYGVLAWLLLRAMGGRGRRAAALWALAVVMAVGGVIELTQPWAGRTCSWTDWLANLAGASLAVAFWLVRLRPVARYSVGPAEGVTGQDAARRP
jgi:VanZ family protein